MNSRPSVLVIDDDEFLLKGLEFALSKLGIRSVLTADPLEFIRHAESGDHDVYLIDLQLSDSRSGLELVDRIRALEGSRPKIMMISAAGEPATIARALERGANDYILKPLDREHLAAKLSRYVMTPQMAELVGGTLSDAPEGRIPGKLSFQTEVIEVSEKGVLLQGPHLLPKGTAAWLSGELMGEIAASSGARGACLVKVTSNWVDSADGFRYGAYAEFDRVHGDIRWFRALRRWLAQQQPSAVSRSIRPQ
jgi:two-component system chemotaxis response regulator CheY